ncbi:hypothetical protein ZYGR_0BA00270 [Zygosaccharomyces rouxii]|uniref:Protein DFG16 n=1 Tax=Zygosaccharomyces rouxii TaxID=4956 RepID=A0A1Q3AK87_ZYGRO|nr:hypothetical protein ZYGR_0BA00270 [Zygosaccharomyces rouxii]
MIRWVVLIATVLVLYSRLCACDVAGLDYDPSHVPQLLSNSSHLLSQLIREFVLDPHGDNCSANLLSGGFLSLKNSTWPTMKNFTVSNPSLFVTCSDDAGGIRDYSDLLRKFAITVESLQVIDDSKHYLKKDDFRDSILMIAFTSCAICVGLWMVYLVLLFQRCPQHAGRRFLLVVYVLFAAIYESINLNIAVQKIFKKQYSGNYQDATEYQMTIVESQGYSVGEIITNALACLNWISIIYYMFQNCNRIHRSWLPNMVSSRNRIIVWVGLSLTVLEELIFALLLWYRWDTGLRITYVLVELCVYSLFFGLICYFVYRDFGFTLLPRKFTTNHKSRIVHIWKSLWNDYHQILLVMIYNLSMFVLLFFTRIYLCITVTADNKWKFKVIKFFKIVITVSVWGLVTVLEKRDSIVSKERVLGRKIKNSDRFFYDVDMAKHDSKYDSSTLDSSYYGSDVSPQTSSWGNSSGADDESNSSVVENNWQLLRFKLPTKAWDSQLKKSKKRRKAIQRTRQKFRNILAGTNRRERNESPKVFKHAISTGEEGEPKISDDTSVETELATNYIYDLQDNHGV